MPITMIARKKDGREKGREGEGWGKGMIAPVY